MANNYFKKYLKYKNKYLKLKKKIKRTRIYTPTVTPEHTDVSISENVKTINRKTINRKTIDTPNVTPEHTDVSIY